jgi:hypothetical protein
LAEAKLRRQKMGGQLVAGVAHNFNNLLTITKATDLLMEDAPEHARPFLENSSPLRGAKLTSAGAGYCTKARCHSHICRPDPRCAN